MFALLNVNFLNLLQVGEYSYAHVSSLFFQFFFPLIESYVWLSVWKRPAGSGGVQNTDEHDIQPGQTLSYLGRGGQVLGLQARVSFPFTTIRMQCLMSWDLVPRYRTPLWCKLCWKVVVLPPAYCCLGQVSWLSFHATASMLLAFLKPASESRMWS